MKFFATGIVATTITIIYLYKYKIYKYKKSILNNNSINQDENPECHPIKKNTTRDQSTQTLISLDRDEGILVKETILYNNDGNKWYDIID